MEKKFICRTDWPVVTTDKGKLRGFFYDDVFQFRGIKYANAKRFQQPEPVEAWEGIKDAQDYGYNAPNSTFPYRQPAGELLTPHRFWPENENCQYLNVFTNTLDTTAKKAVMVWLHGGGYSGGSAIELTYYDGDNLARNEDVVVVTLNHRLNVFGFLDMSSYGPEYENSVNAGMADIVAALQWVHDNIAQFGGDPENVTIFGQSGGGGKVSALEQIPAAAGLFHKAIVMSGSIPDDDGLVYTTATGKQIAEAIMDELGCPEHDIESILTCPEVVLVRAMNRALNNLKAEGYAIGWGPQKNGWYEGWVGYNGVSEHSKNIPTIFGTELSEFGRSPFNDLNAVPEEERVAYLKEKFGEENGAKLVELYEKAFPGVNVLNVLTLDMMFRPTTKAMIKARAKECTAPNYNYIMSLEFPINGGKRAWHCADIPFAFGNALDTPICNIEGVTEKVQNQFCKAFTNFAKTGNPNHALIPEWKPCTETEINTMIFDTDADLRTNFDEELVEFYGTLVPKFAMKFPAGKNPDKNWVY